MLDAETKGKEEAIEHLRGRVTEEESKARQAEAKLQIQGEEIADLKSKWEMREACDRRNRALAGYCCLLFLIVGTAVLSAWFSAGHLPELVSLIGINWTSSLFGVPAFVLLHLLFEWYCVKANAMNELWLFKQVRRFRVWLWTFAILGFVVGVVGNLVANRIQQNLDNRKTLPQPLPAEVPIEEP